MVGRLVRNLRHVRYCKDLRRKLLTSTVLGAMAMALKDMAAGRDPRRWTDEETYLDPDVWGAALLQAGGLGIYGDFLCANTNRFGGGLASTVAGPLVERVNTLRNFTVGNAQQLIQGKPTNFGEEGVKLLRQNTPGGTLWYLRLAYERMLLDQLQMMVDPDARKPQARLWPGVLVGAGGDGATAGAQPWGDDRAVALVSASLRARSAKRHMPPPRRCGWGWGQGRSGTGSGMGYGLRQRVARPW